MAPRYPCAICDSHALEDIPGYTALPRATSDSKPWPRGGTLAVCMQCGAIQHNPNLKWLNEIDQIYANYDIYHQSAGSEHLVFSGDGIAKSRSNRLVEYV